MTEPSERIVIRCVEVRQPIGTFYIGAIAADDLRQIAYADVRRIRAGEPRDIEEFSGIQRPLSESRVKELEKYVRTVDAAFPTSVILDVKSEDVEFEQARSLMSIRRHSGVAKIIDGQHRIAGLAEYRGGMFEVNVTIFVDMDMEDQAMLFATINLKQTKVNKSLAYDLYEFAAQRSPQKAAHIVARLLNAKETSPFFQRIKILGTANTERDETLTQAAFVDNLLPLISLDPMLDRDALKRGKEIPVQLRNGTEPALRQLFRDGKDAEIARIVWNYFHAVRERWPVAWSSVSRGGILNRTTGFSALMRFLPIAYRHLDAGKGGIPTSESFGTLLKGVDIKDVDFTREKYLPGSAGIGLLYNELLVGSGLGREP